MTSTPFLSLALQAQRLLLGPLQCPVSGPLTEQLEQVILATLYGYALLTGDALIPVNQGWGSNRAAWSAYMDRRALQSDQRQRCLLHQAQGMVSGSLRFQSLTDDPVHTLDETTHRDIEHIVLAWRLFDPAYGDDGERWACEYTLPAPPELAMSWNHPYWQQVIQAIQPGIQGVFDTLGLEQPNSQPSPEAIATIIELQGGFNSTTEPPSPVSSNISNDPLLGLLQAQSLQQQGDYARAAQQFHHLSTHELLSDTFTAHCKNLAAQNYALADTPEEAIYLWEELLQHNPEHPQAALNLALHYEQHHQLDRAKALFHQHQQHHPQDLRAFFGLARIYSKQEDWPNALTQYKKQLQLSPQDAWCLSNLATCELQLGHEQDAITYLKQAQNLDPDGDAGQYAQLVLMQFEGPLL